LGSLFTFPALAMAADTPQMARLPDGMAENSPSKWSFRHNRRQWH
jgi:hypothetical protein